MVDDPLAKYGLRFLTVFPCRRIFFMAFWSINHKDQSPVLNFILQLMLLDMFSYLVVCLVWSWWDSNPRPIACKAIALAKLSYDPKCKFLYQTLFQVVCYNRTLTISWELTNSLIIFQWTFDKNSYLIQKNNLTDFTVTVITYTYD